MEKSNSLIIGNCIIELSKLPENSISACITDPPYNYEFVGKDWNFEEINRRISRTKDSNTLVKNLPYGSGLAGGVRNKSWYAKNRKNAQDYQEWCHEWGREVFRVCKPGAAVVAFNSTRSLAQMQVGLEEAGFYPRDVLVYRRPSGIPKGFNMEKALEKTGSPDAELWSGWHSCFRNEWEAIVVLQKPLENNYRTTVERHGVGLFKTVNQDGTFQSNILENYHERNKQSFNVHCTVKPLGLMEKLVETFVPEGEDHVVLDPFAGSGTTLVAAKNLGRKFIGIEIVPEYAEVIEQRLAVAEETPRAIGLW